MGPLVTALILGPLFGLHATKHRGRRALEAAEQTRETAQGAEAAAREAARKLDEGLGRLTAEARALAALVAQARRGGFAPALDAVSPDRGYENALAAALGSASAGALPASRLPHTVFRSVAGLHRFARVCAGAEAWGEAETAAAGAVVRIQRM